MRHAFRGLHRSMVFGDAAAINDVESSSHLPYQAAVFRLTEILPGDTYAIQFTRPECAGFPDHAGDKFCLGSCHPARRVSNFAHRYEFGAEQLCSPRRACSSEATIALAAAKFSRLRSRTQIW
jgi:hypothetical protein